MESRLGFLCQPKAFKVFLDVEDEIASQRIHNDQRITDEYQSSQQALEMTRQRNLGDQKRYFDLYGVDLWDPKHYDLLIDTSYKTPEEVVQEILVAFENYQKLS